MTDSISGSRLDGGCVRLRLGVRGDSVSSATVVSERPEVSRLLCGRNADAAVTLIPMIFAVCGKAQGMAATLALAAARGVDAAPCLSPLIETEVMREHLWHLMLDLPPLLGLESQRALFVQTHQALAAGDKKAVLTVLGNPFWNELLSALDTQTEPEVLAGSVGALLPVMSAQQSITTWPRLSTEMAGRPLWQGLPAETGAFARSNGQNPGNAGAFAVRWHSRYAEVRLWAAGGAKVGAGGTASAASVAPGIGRALVETARGLLMHEITLQGDTVTDYRIVAPTEWNFHPDGVITEWLRGHRAADRRVLAGFVAAAVAVLDPCVRHEVEWVWI